MSLYKCFEQVADPRELSGLRMPLPALLCMITMSYLSSNSGYLATGAFMKGNADRKIDTY